MNHQATATVMSPCSSNKKRHSSKGAAEDYARYCQKRFPDTPLQRAYACAECGDWHLTTHLVEPQEQSTVTLVVPDARNTLTLEAPNTTPTTRTSRKGRPLSAQSIAQRKGAFNRVQAQHPNASVNELARLVAAELKIGFNAAYSFYFNYIKDGGKGVYVRNGLRVSDGLSSFATVEAITAKEERLLRELERVRQHKAQLIAARRPRVVADPKGDLMIQRGHSNLRLTFEEGNALLKNLTDFLAKRISI